ESCLELSNGSRMYALPGGSPDTIRGYSSVDLILVDEGSRVADDLFPALMPMLMMSGGRLVVLSNPKGASGWVYQQWQNDEGEGERVMVRASECSRATPEFLAAERKRMSEREFAAEYECAFLGQGSSVFTHVHEAIDKGRTENPTLVTDRRLGFQL